MKNRNLLFRLTLMAVMCICSVTMFAQQKVSGVIVDTNGEPIIGASILEKGTDNGTISDFDGNFAFTTTKPNAMLLISYVGYISQEKKAAANMKIALKEDSKALDEIVVVGYGVQKKSVVTGAISSVKAEEMMTSANTRPEQALQGKTSGVMVLSSSGAPGSSMKIRVRGYASNGDSDPLYIVDGLRTTDISTLEPSNIETMEVLKDGASAAIYGAEGGNGVVLITTKQGKSGKTQINYNFQFTLQSVGKTPDVMNASQYSDYMKQGNQSVTWDGVTDTDWLKECFETAPMQKHNLSVSGGNDKSTYLMSLSYLDQSGIVVGDQDNYSRYSGMFNGSVQTTKWMKVSSSIQLNRSKKTSFTEFDESRGVISNAVMIDPCTPVYYTDNNNLPSNVTNFLAANRDLMKDENGNYYGISSNVTGECINPLVQRTLQQTTTTNSSLIGNITMDLTPFEGFRFTSKLGLNYNQSNVHVYKPEFFYSTEMQNNTASVSESDATMTYWQWENYASYNKEFGKHNITVMLGSAISEREYKTVRASGYPLLKDQESFADLDFISSQSGSNVSGTTLTDRKASFFGRVNYDYEGKYMLEATLRKDGAGLSILPSNKRWGLFPAVSAGWVFTRENFFPQNTPITYGKLRASWGRNGSLSNLRNYTYTANIASSGSGLSYLTWSYINASYLYPNSNGGYSTAAYPSSLGNYDLTWETSEQIDLGLDLRFFNDRLTFGVDWYNKKTKDLITTNTPALEAGNTASPINGGNVENKGFDFELGWKDRINDFTYSINANLSTLKNNVTYLDSSISRINGVGLMQWTGATAFEIGHPVWYFRGYKTDGVDAEGNIKIVDVDKDGVITTGDYTDIGSAIPDFTYGLTLNMGYKGWDFTMFLNGSHGNKVLNGMRRPDRLSTNKLACFYTDAWSDNNQGAKYPSIKNQVSSAEFWNSDMMVFDGSYLKIKQIQLGYTLPKSLVNRATLQNVRAYVSLDDFFTFTNYPGMDPEASTTANNSIGVDRGFFPISRKVMFGLSVTL